MHRLNINNVGYDQHLRSVVYVGRVMPSRDGARKVEPGGATSTAAAAAAAAAASPAWRQFSFFESTLLRDANDFGQSPAAVRNPNEIAAVCHCPVRPPISTSALASASDVASTSADTASSTAKPSQRIPCPCILVGTIHGTIKVLDSDSYTELASWDAFSSSGVSGRVTHLSTDARGRVISLGEEDSSRFPILRIWDIRAKPAANVTQAQEGRAEWMPRLLAEGKVQHGSRPHPIAALAHSPSQSYLSVALADGTVLLIRGLDSALMAATGSAGFANSVSNTRPSPAIALPKFKVVFQPTVNESGGHEPVTALGFSEAVSTTESAKDMSTATYPAAAKSEARGLSGSRGRKGPMPRQRDPRAAAQRLAAAAQPETAPTAVYLFIVTLSRVLRYVVAGKGAGGSAAVLDDVGSALGCAAVIPHKSANVSQTNNRNALGSRLASAGKMVIARDEAIYVIGQEGREACLAYESRKSSIHLSASQLIIVSPPFAPSASSTSATVRNFVNSRDQATPSSASGSSPMVSRRTNDLPSEIAKVTIFDLDNKLVAFSGTFESGIREAWIGPSGEVLVLSDTGDLTRLDEKPLRAKLDILYRKSLFLLAVNLAKSHAERAVSQDAVGRIEALMGDIYQRYGDHLYTKGDFDGAMAQYVKTVGHTQPSFVIRKFLDAQRITNLTTYLQELHAQNLASSDHTTLLLNCYTKLKDVASLDRFIKRPHAQSASERPTSPDGGDGDLASDRDDLPFDLETAMRVCRQAGYYDHAAYLAKRYGEHREYLRIRIEDAHDCHDALVYVRGLEPNDAIHSMAQYANTLLDEMPEQTTDFLIELCSGAFHPTPDAAQSSVQLATKQLAAASGGSKTLAAGYLSYLQVGGFGKTSSATETSAPGGPRLLERSSALTPVESVENGEQTAGNASTEFGDGEKGENTLHREQKMLAYVAPSPRTFFAHFIQHPTQFIRFLETVALARWGQSVDMDLRPIEKTAAVNAPMYAEEGQGEMDDVDRALRELGLSGDADLEGYEDQDTLDQKSIWNTLLELYLTSWRKGGRKDRALQLLRQHETLPYDINHAVMLCSMDEFTEGLVLLYERMSMYQDIVRFYMDAAVSSTLLEADQDEASRQVIAALHKYGPHRPELYSMVLRFLVSDQAVLERHTEDLSSVLSVIAQRQLMSTLEMVQVLSSTEHVSVGLVRDLITNSIQQDTEATLADYDEIDNSKATTADALAEISELTDETTPRIFQMTQCTACDGQLDLPSVHFMCKHSYHQRCLGENETECPTCAHQHGLIREMRRREQDFAQHSHDLLDQLQHPHNQDDDGFARLAELYGKGIMGAAQTAQQSV